MKNYKRLYEEKVRLEHRCPRCNRATFSMWRGLCIACKDLEIRDRKERLKKNDETMR